MIQSRKAPDNGTTRSITLESYKSTGSQTSEWSVLDNAHRIERTYTVKNFAEAYAVQKIAELAEAEGHHPDIGFGWGKLQSRCKQRRSKACTRMTSSWPRK